MMSQSDLEQIIQKTRQYEFSDGLRDLQFAVLCGFGGLSAWLSFEPFWMTIIGNAIKTFGRWAAWIGMLPVVLYILAVLGMLRLMEHFRKRWLWRDTGMVKASKWLVSCRVNLISAIIILGGISISLGLHYVGRMSDALVLRMIWTATGWGFGYTLIGVGQDIGLPRYIWVGAAGGLVSTIMLFLPLSFGQSSLVFGLIWFFLLMVSGIFTLRSAIIAMKKANIG